MGRRKAIVDVSGGSLSVNAEGHTALAHKDHSMHNRFTFTAAVVLALALSLPARAEDAPTGASVVARVNGIEITLGHLITARQSLPPQYQQLPDAVLFPGLLDQLVNQTLLAGSVSEQSTRVRLAIENESRSILAGEAIEAALLASVSEEALLAAYKAKYEASEPTREWNASHILVTTREEADDLVKALEAGADFAALAQEKSTGPSGPNGGDLGWFGPGMMVPAFEEAVAVMEAGKISAPIETQFGWHVIKLNETRVVDAPKLDEVRDELQQEIQKTALDARIAELTKDAKIEKPGAELDPSLLSNIDLLEK